MARIPGEPDVAVVATSVEANAPSSIDWAAVIAGAFVAAAISFVLLTFGTAIGLSITSPYPREGISVTAFLVILALWVIWVSLTSFFAGGYLAGRMRRRVSLSRHEAEVRDGVHGILVWALGILIGSLITAWTAGGIAKTGAQAASASATAVAAGFSSALTKAADPVAYLADTLFRPGPTPPAGQPAAARGDPRAEAARIFARSAASGDVSADDQ